MNNSQQHSIRFAKKQVSRKRATKACLKCRKRKVRCDVTRTSTPCTNCRLDGCECVVARRADALYVVIPFLLFYLLTCSPAAPSQMALRRSPQMISYAIAKPSQLPHHQLPATITQQVPSKRLPQPCRTLKKANTIPYIIATGRTSSRQLTQHPTMLLKRLSGWRNTRQRHFPPSRQPY
jgi:hypothetical protein